MQNSACKMLSQLNHLVCNELTRTRTESKQTIQTQQTKPNQSQAMPRIVFISFAWDGVCLLFLVLPIYGHTNTSNIHILHKRSRACARACEQSHERMRPISIQHTLSNILALHHLSWYELKFCRLCILHFAFYPIRVRCSMIGLNTTYIDIFAIQLEFRWWKLLRYLFLYLLLGYNSLCLFRDFCTMYMIHHVYVYSHLNFTINLNTMPIFKLWQRTIGECHFFSLHIVFIERFSVNNIDILMMMTMMMCLLFDCI